MTLSFDTNDNLLTITNRVKNAPEADLALEIPTSSVFWQSPANQTLVEKLARNNGKAVRFPKPKGTQGPDELEKPLRSDPSVPSSPSPAKTKRRKKRPWGKLLVIGAVLVVLAAGAALAAAYYYLPRAEVKLIVAKKTLEKETQVKIDPQASAVSVEDKILPGKKIQAERSATKSFPATGSKTVGEKALGEATIRNWTNAAVTIEQGVFLTVDVGQTGAGLRFITDTAVQVPPQSLDNTQGVRTAGTINVPITAEKFGTEYNLPANLDFLVGERPFDQFSAINQQPFNGGTTEQVTIVTQEDLNNAQEQLKAELFASGEEALAEKVSQGGQIAADTIDHASAFAEFSQEAGAEVENFTLTMRTVSQAVTYHEDQLKELLEESLQESVPEGFVLSDDDVVVTVKGVQRQADASLVANGVIKALVLPELDLEKLKEQLVGVKPAEAQQILQKTPKLEGFAINLSPRLPEPIATLPYRAERLTLTIETQ